MVALAVRTLPTGLRLEGRPSLQQALHEDIESLSSAYWDERLVSIGDFDIAFDAEVMVTSVSCVVSVIGCNSENETHTELKACAPRKKLLVGSARLLGDYDLNT